MADYKEGDIADGANGEIYKFQGGKWHQFDAGGLEVLGGGYRRNQIGQTWETGPKGGTKQVAGPTFTAANEAAKKAANINQSLAGIDRVDRQLQNTRTIGPFGWITNPTDLAVLKQSVKDLQLKLKEQPYNLGVLNGPDLDLLESIVANPEQLNSAVFRKTIAPRLANLSSILGNTYRQDASAFEGLGGRAEAVPPLYRSPRSKYSAEEWGRQGRVPPAAMQRNVFAQGRPAKSPAKTSGGYKILSVE